MGDRSWLGFGGRARTPQPAQQSLPADESSNDDDGTTTIRAGDLNNQRTLQRSNTEVPPQKNPHKAPRLSRFSSLMGLNGTAKAQSPTATSFEIAPNYPENLNQLNEPVKIRSLSYHETAHDLSAGIWRKNSDAGGELRYRESDATWHNPNLKQMIETIQCTIMTNGISTPIPSNLNHFVAGMIEEFSVHIGEMKKLKEKVASLETTRATQAQEFRETTNEWQEREQRFKDEIKRLECIISDTQKGAESVHLARAASVCNRNDARAFRAKLDRLSQSDEDANKQTDTSNQRPVSILRNVNTQVQDSAGPSGNLRVVVYSRNVPEKRDGPELKQQTMCVRFDPAIGEIGNSGHKVVVPNQSKNRNSDSTTGSSASGLASSTSSGIEMGQGNLANVSHPNHITPATSPPRCPLPKANTGTNHVQTLRELILANGGLPENAIDDDDSYITSFVPPRHVRAYSFDEGDDTADCSNGVSIRSNTPQNTVAKSLHPSSRGSKVPAAQRTAKRGLDRRSPKISHKTQEQRSKTRQASASSAASCSPTMRFMGRNHVGRANSNPGDGRGVFTPGYSSPTRKAESGQEPYPNQETIQIARQLRTVNNTSGNMSEFLTDEELAITKKEIIAARECAQLDTRARTSTAVRFLSTNIREESAFLDVQSLQHPGNQPAHQG